MGRCNVEYKGKYASFSSIVDAFITEFMSKEDYETWELLEYGKNLRPIEFNMKSMGDVSFSIRLNRSHDEAIECLLECGLSKEESEQIIYDIETKYYVPIPKENSKFKCPNCGNEIEKEQFECDNDTCLLKFVWRI